LKTSPRNYEPSYQLDLLSENCSKLSPQIYKVHALYLQILRKVIRDEIEKALFNILTDENISNNTSFDIENISVLKKNVYQIISKTISYFTIEQLTDYSYELKEERKKNIEKTKKEVIENVNRESNKHNHKKDLTGSIDISILPPIDNPSQIDKWFVLEDPVIALENNDQLEEPFIDRDGFEEDETFNDNCDEKINQKETIKYEKDINDKRNFDVFKSLFINLGQSFKLTKILNKDQNNYKEKELLIPLIASKENNRLLPKDPSLLIDWINNIDYALTKVLNNLSHDINLEMLKLGIVSSILPVSFFDAVLSGQISTLDAEPNLLKLKVPTANSMLTEFIFIDGLFVKTNDLEFDIAQLKICRSRIRKYINILSKMTKKQRYWQSKFIANEVNNKWRYENKSIEIDDK
tara:strand:+ start:1214 stop:2437 length:1224 start_codon:yes stop_codon:yes gene_type:complete